MADGLGAVYRQAASRARALRRLRPAHAPRGMVRPRRLNNPVDERATMAPAACARPLKKPRPGRPGREVLAKLVGSVFGLLEVVVAVIVEVPVDIDVAIGLDVDVKRVVLGRVVTDLVLADRGIRTADTRRGRGRRRAVGGQ